MKIINSVHCDLDTGLCSEGTKSDSDSTQSRARLRTDRPYLKRSRCQGSTPLAAPTPACPTRPSSRGVTMAVLPPVSTDGDPTKTMDPAVPPPAHVNVDIIPCGAGTPRPVVVVTVAAAGPARHRGHRPHGPRTATARTAPQDHRTVAQRRGRPPRSAPSRESCTGRCGSGTLCWPSRL